MPTIYDVSVPVQPGKTPIWPGDPAFQMERFLKMEDGEPANVTKFSGCVHLGTHVDAPYHFIPNGATVESLPLDALVGEAYVLDFTYLTGHITAEALKAANIPKGATRLLFKTRNSQWWTKGDPEFHRDFTALTADGAEYLVRRGIRLVGNDYLSIAPYDDPGPTHRILLGAGVVVIETLDLSAVPAGRYTLYCLPLKLVGSEGAPARTILIAE